MCITEFDEKIYEAELRRESREEGRILDRIEVYKEDDYSDENVLAKISQKFNLTPEKSLEYLKKYYNELNKCNS